MHKINTCRSKKRQVFLYISAGIASRQGRSFALVNKNWTQKIKKFTADIRFLCKVILSLHILAWLGRAYQVFRDCQAC
jgi:hypothetical protein